MPSIVEQRFRSGLKIKFLQHGLHLTFGMGIAGAFGAGYSLGQALLGFLRAACAGQRLGGHKVAGSVVRIIGQKGGKLLEGGLDLAGAGVFHGQSVAGEGILRVLGKDFEEHGFLVHMIRVITLDARLYLQGSGWREKDLRALKLKTGTLIVPSRERAPAWQKGLMLEGAVPEARDGSESQSEMTELILPNDTNTLGNLLGGRLMHLIDLVAAMAALRHARTHVVTASMDHIDFIAPVHVGDLLILKSSVNRSFRTSMEVGVKVWTENTLKSTHRHVGSAYLTFVAITEQGQPTAVPGLRPSGVEGLRRFEDAGRRRELRKMELGRKRAKQQLASPELAGPASLERGC